MSLNNTLLLSWFLNADLQAAVQTKGRVAQYPFRFRACTLSSIEPQALERRGDPGGNAGLGVPDNR